MCETQPFERLLATKWHLYIQVLEFGFQWMSYLLLKNDWIYNNGHHIHVLHVHVYIHVYLLACHSFCTFLQVTMQWVLLVRCLQMHLLLFLKLVRLAMYLPISACTHTFFLFHISQVSLVHTLSLYQKTYIASILLYQSK